ncbi:S8 family serine peptidase [Thermus antranikianii]
MQIQGLGKFEGEYAPGELLVLPRPGLSVQVLRTGGAEPQEALPRGFLRVKVPPGQEKARAEALLKVGAQYVQPNYVYRPLVVVPNDRYYPLQKSYLDGLVKLETGWSYSTGRGCPPLVAVLDTGMLPHEDVRTSFYLPQGVRLDVADGDSNPMDRTVGDSFGHGLEVASVLGADTNNGEGISGVTWGGYLVPIKVFKDGSDATTTFDLAKGVDLAERLGVRVINISLGKMGVSESDGVLMVSLAQARARGVVVVAAAGNYEQSNGGPVMFPASDPSTIAVGAVDTDKQRASFSAYGLELDLVAPGVNVLVAGPSGDYLLGSGTSFASPIVAGVVALYMSKYASERREWPSPDQVYRCLTGTAEDLGPSGPDDEYGFGLVRADRVMTDTTYCFPP